MVKEKKNKALELMKPYRFRLFWTILFLLVAILFLTIGFGKTIVLIIFGLLGYIIGKMRDEELDIYSLIDTLRSMLGN